MLGLALGAMLVTGSGGLLADGAAAAGARLLEPAPLELGLRLELDRLEAERPSLGWPVALTSTGGGLVLAGVGLVVGSIVAFPRAPDSLLPLAGTPYAIAGLISAGVGVLLVVVAGERLVNALGLRRALDAQASVVRRQLLAAERARTPPDAPSDLPADAPTRVRLTAPAPGP